MILDIRFGAAALVLALAGCGEGGSENAAPVSREQVASRARDFVKPEPGLYRSTVEIEEFAIPGAPPQVAEMMRNSAKSNQSHDYCVTAEDVEKGFEETLRKSQQGECDYKRFDIDGGRIDAALTCRDQGRTVDIQLSGTGTATSSDMAMSMTMDLPGMGEGTIRARSRSERIGACPA